MVLAQDAMEMSLTHSRILNHSLTRPNDEVTCPFGPTKSNRILVGFTGTDGSSGTTSGHDSRIRFDLISVRLYNGELRARGGHGCAIWEMPDAMKHPRTHRGILVGLTLVAVTAAWGADTIDVAKDWRFAPDPHRVGVGQGWMQPGFDDSAWAVVDAGKRWEDQGFPEVDGAAWYRKRVMVPASIRAPHVWLNLGGINDSGTIYCNGAKIATFGDENAKSITSTPVAANLSAHIRWGEENLLAIHAFDQGLSGGLTKSLCALTTDPSTLPAGWRLRFVPGFDSQPSIVGLDMGPQDLPGTARLRVTLSINDDSPVVREVAPVTDYQGRPMGATEFDLDLGPGDRLHITAKILDAPNCSKAGFPFERVYQWPRRPRWQGEYGDLRVLNNFVTELKAVDRIEEASSQYDFLNPREGWVFIRVQHAENPVAHVNDEIDALIWRVHPETGAFESMQYLIEGEHRLRMLNGAGARLDIRAIPETICCPWPLGASLKALPERDQAYADRFVLPNMNTLVTYGDAGDAFHTAWRAEGRRYLGGGSALGLNHATPPRADDVFEEWISSKAAVGPSYAGMMVDEFLSKSADHYAAWTHALERLHDSGSFTDKTFYAWVQSVYSHPPALAFMRTLYAHGGRFGWMRYCHEEPTEEAARLHIHEMLSGLNEWELLMPGVKERIVVYLGAFIAPNISLNNNPGADYTAYMDLQFQTLATDPTYFGLRGLAQWSSYYADDHSLRYAQQLFRHYCIEGERTPFQPLPYVLSHITNPDFENGLQGWHVEAADSTSVVSDTHLDLGLLQGRWKSYGDGDTCAIMTRDDRTPNRVGQTIQDLSPGNLYTLKTIAANLDQFSVEADAGLHIEIDGVERIEDRSFRHLTRSPISTQLEQLGEESHVFTTYHQVTFRAISETAELTFSDWKDDMPTGPEGQRIAFNFVEVQPFFEK